ncbi:unnamed protein product [Oikopleura dioica]|uniref:RING-type domain-containing protein n=1 Tax=Oikopleura dioica TaxID=34765 RepID=E4Y364_OIKDI|nr:unnamed protein product [Oikopleura dioica]
MVYCRTCLHSKYPENKTAKFEVTDAKFKCPSVEKCNADQLSWEEFWVGACCENASRWTENFFKSEFLTLANNIYKKSRKEENEAEIIVEKAEKEIENCKKALEAAEKKGKEAHDELNEKKKWRKTVQKRTLFLANEAMKEDNSDLETDDAEENKESRAENEDKTDGREDDDKSCKVCFEDYDKKECLRATVIPRGHQSCFKCLSSLPEKICPTCRAEFTKDWNFTRPYPGTFKI